jgi:dTDP-4-amino-4,6-dideoxygalactose transaminase
MTRDELYEKLKRNNIFGRRYFYPVVSQFPTYRGLASSSESNLEIASKATQEVLCLPIYPDLKENNINKITNLIKYH